ncbi:SDR family NAD(P)-dependent oxidoreductase [Spirochaetota bacterium]
MKTKKNTYALITGASSGIGMAFARSLAMEGHDLVLVARRKEQLEKLARELTKYNIDIKIFSADLSSDSGVTSLESKIIQKHNIHLLINSAGFGTRGHFADLDAEKIQKMIYLHTMAPARLTRAVLPEMIKNNSGIIIAISSLAAFLTTAEYVTYSATKSFLNTFCTGLSDELAATNVKIYSICPGLTKTEFMSTEEYKNFNYNEIPDFAWMTPEDVVEISLKKINSVNKPVIIPGAGNRFFVAILNFPLLGLLIRNLLRYLSRRRIIQGKPALY